MSDTWNEISCDEQGIVLKKHKQYPDGTDVTITIHEINQQYEIKSIAEHRCSGPNESSEGVFVLLPEAIKAIEEKCKSWDEWQARWS
jgi:hypothetical protein